jgi:HEAT repeat protein
MSLLCWAGTAPAQQQRPSGPLGRLATALLSAAAERPSLVAEAVRELRTINDLRQALDLVGWQLRDDQDLRSKIRTRLTNKMKAAANSSDPTIRRVLADWLGEIGLSKAKYGREESAAFTRERTDLLLKLLSDSDARIRATAAASLAKINPDPQKKAVAALKALYAAGDTNQRRAAVKALYDLVDNTARVYLTETGPEAPVKKDDVVNISTEVLRNLATVAGCADRDVRRLYADTVERAARAMADLLPVFQETDRKPSVIASYRSRIEELQPLEKGLKAQGKALAGLLTDRDVDVRLSARRALAEMARIGLKLRILQESLGIEKSPRVRGRDKNTLVPTALEAAAAETDVLADAVRPTLAVLRKGIDDPNVAVRLASLDVLELLEEKAAPAAPAIIRAMRDRNHFVRWAAARTLGKSGPFDASTAKKAVPALVRVLADRDLDLQLAAVTTLANFGPRAREAVPALVRATQAGDADFRIAAMQTLSAIVLPSDQDQTPQVIAALINSLTDRDPRIRQAAASTLGDYGSAARSAIPALRKAFNEEGRKALSDEDRATVQQAITGALLDIGGE